MIGSTGGPLPPPSVPVPLAADHNVFDFECGRPSLNEWLGRSALRSQGETARTYVVVAEERVVGYYSLAAGSVTRGTLPSARLRRNTPDAVPVIVLGRLAVDGRFHGFGIGSGLVRDAILRSVEASSVIGVKAILVHAIDDEAVRFYERFDFAASPMNPRTLILPIATAIAALGCR